MARRMTRRATNARARVYIGETDDLRRRLSDNYRSPGSGQQTSLRINAVLREHLAASGNVALAVAVDATVRLDGVEQSLDLAREAGRLLAENAALVLTQVTDDADIVNLGQVLRLHDGRHGTARHGTTFVDRQRVYALAIATAMTPWKLRRSRNFHVCPP